MSPFFLSQSNCLYDNRSDAAWILVPEYAKYPKVKEASQLSITTDAGSRTPNFEQSTTSSKVPLRQMRPRGSNRNSQKVASIAPVERQAASPPPELESWQPRVLSVKIPCQNYWLIDSAADFHIRNDRSLITGYQEQPKRIGRFTSDSLSWAEGRYGFDLALKTTLL